MYLTRADLLVQIRDTKLAQITEGDDGDTIIALAAGTAVQTVRDALSARYDLPAIFDREGDERHPQVLRWCATLALYYLWERVPDRLLPERVKDNYAMTMAALGEISDAKASVELPLKLDPEGAPITKFRWGGDEPRQW